MKSTRCILAAILTLAVLAPPVAQADVSSVEITERGPIEDGRAFGDAGPYELIAGRVTFAVDPADPRNQVIANLDLAPTNADGMVEATADLRILAPADPARGNGVALVDIANRGRLTALGFNRGGSGPYGDGFLMEEGYTVVWVGWEFDVPEGRPIRFTVPSVDGDPVGGLGFAAIRDTASWIKHDPDAAVTADHALSFGSSQSGRYLRTFLYLGFNTDTSGRQVFDGMIPHIAGASRLDLNQPGATPISLGMFDATSFPFADAALRDPVTGVVDGTLGNDRSRGNQPRIFYTNTGVEYWGGGRVATLVHATPDGEADIDLQENVRFYLLAGTQHGPGAFPPPDPGNRQEMGNPTDYWWNMRALLTALKDWVVDGVEPPLSRHPRFADANLVPPRDIGFPAIPGVRSPHDRTGGTRVRNTWLAGADDAGVPLPMLVPAVDADGNETSGIRHPEVAVPLATYTGWNFTHPDSGDPDSLVALAGVLRAVRGHAGRTRGGGGSAAVDRGALRVSQGVPGEGRGGGARAGRRPLPAGRRPAGHSRPGRTALGSADRRALTRPCRRFRAWTVLTLTLAGCGDGANPLAPSPSDPGGTPTFTDGLHLSAAGYALWTQIVTPDLPATWVQGSGIARSRISPGPRASRRT